MKDRTKTPDQVAVHLTHHIPGRLRLKIPERRGDRDFFDAVAHVLDACEGVTSVTTNPVTGSILVFHTAPLQTIVEYARHFGFSPPSGWPASPAAPVPRSQGNGGSNPATRQGNGHHEAETSPDRRAGTGTWGLSQPIAAAFAGFGLVQLAEGNVFAPALSLFWYATQIWQFGKNIDRKFKYGQGDLGMERSFFFRGPDYRLNLRACNLKLFVEMAAAVDDAIWMHHLRSGDYSRWLRDSLKDEDLAGEVRGIETQPNPDPAISRLQVQEAIERRYAG